MPRTIQHIVTPISTSTSTEIIVRGGNVNSSDDGSTVANVVPTSQSKVDKNVERAVYGYIRAVRALGRETVNTSEISKALSLPLKQVDRAANALAKRGVKRAKE